MNQNVNLERKVWIAIGLAAALLISTAMARSSPLILLSIFSSVLVGVAIYFLLVRLSYIKENRPNGAKHPTNKQQITGIGLFLIPLIAAFIWGVIALGGLCKYMLVHSGTATYATVEGAEQYVGSGRSSPAINVYIEYDGHHGVLQQSTSDRGYLNPIYAQFLKASQEDRKIRVHYLKGLPFIVLSDSQLGLVSPNASPKNNNSSNPIQIPVGSGSEPNGIPLNANTND